MIPATPAVADRSAFEAISRRTVRTLSAPAGAVTGRMTALYVETVRA